MVVWGGRKWWLNQGYYCNRLGQLLHRAIYAEAHGPIPDGIDIHHEDEDPTNNEISNLEAVTKREHYWKHGHRGWANWDKERRSAVSSASWEAKEPRIERCLHCGEPFSTIAQRAKFCSNNCKSADRRKRVREGEIPGVACKCAACGVDFVTHKSSARFCSLACNAQIKIRPPSPCAICGQPFKSRNPKMPTCSRACGYALRSRRAEARKSSAGLQP
jgi:hypothetical protein